MHAPGNVYKSFYLLLLALKAHAIATQFKGWTVTPQEQRIQQCRKYMEANPTIEGAIRAAEEDLFFASTITWMMAFIAMHPAKEFRFNP